MKRAPLALAIVLAGVQATLLVRTAWDKTDTIDEPVYIAAGIHQWTRVLSGNVNQAFERNCESPALPKWGIALGLRLADPPLFENWAKRPAGAKEPDPLGPPSAHARNNLFAARGASILITTAAGLFLFAAALPFGPAAALLTQALWCFSPTVLAQGSLATLDGWAAALSALALWAGVRLWQQPSAGRALGLGGAVGLAAACKVPAAGMLPVAFIFALGLVRRSTGRWQPARVARLWAALAGGFCVTLWAVYGCSLRVIQTNDLCGTAGGLGYHSRMGPLPFPAWIEGLLLQWLHGEGGHLSYLFGRTGSDGWWWFYLACLALKTTIGAQAAGLFGIAATLKRRLAYGEALGDAAILAFPALLLAVMSLGSTQNGIRYILPLFPFGMFWLGRALPRVSAAFGRRGRAVLLVMVGVGALESLAIHPDHLMFFNRWAGGPPGGPRYLIHGDDWGQDQGKLAEFMKGQKPWRLYYTFYNGNPGRWGLLWEQAPCQPTPGYYALQAVEVHRPKRIEAGCLDWLTVEPPDARIGYSIYFYQVTRARIERLVAERDSVKPFWRSGADPGRGR